MVLDLPARSQLEISFEFEKSLLKWLEYPPDANKGFYVNSAVITTVLPEMTNFTGIPRRSSTYFHTFSNVVQDSKVLVQLYTEALLVNLPTPDFSMPYNVICLTCTVVALAFGPLHNITTKSLTKVQPNEVPPGPLDKLKKFIKGKFSKEEPKNTEDTEQETESKKDKSLQNFDLLFSISSAIM